MISKLIINLIYFQLFSIDLAKKHNYAFWINQHIKHCNYKLLLIDSNLCIFIYSLGGIMTIVLFSLIIAAILNFTLELYLKENP